MFINTGINQYNSYGNNNVNQNQSTQSLTGNTVNELKSGQVFEGSVNSIDSSGRVVIGLANGQTMSARLDSGVSLTQGQSLFFQVKSNDGSLIQIKPISLNIDSNPTLLKALDSASVLATEKSIAMVNSMMNQSMPIDAESIATMNRIMLNNPDINPQTLVLMSKFGLDITTETASMFENYSNNQIAITNDLSQIIEDIPKLLTSNMLSSEDAVDLVTEIDRIFNSDNTIDSNMANMSNSLISDESIDSFNNETSKADFLNENNLNNEINIQENEQSINSTNFSANSLLNEDIKSILNNNPEVVSKLNSYLDSNNNLNSNVSSNEIFKAIIQSINDSSIDSNSLKLLFSSKEFKNIVTDIISNNFYIKPEDIIKPKELTKLYDRILQETQELEKAVQNISSKFAESIKHSTSNIKNNISFMNTSNDIYTFLQIPLKMYDQKTDSTLYVRQNNKHAYKEGDEITAFLHFEMEYLGSTDVYISLKGKDVSCKWNLQSESSMKLIEDNIDILNQRLSNKGFNCSMEVSCTDKKLDFVGDFLNSDNNVSNGLLHRYSFDMRA